MKTTIEILPIDEVRIIKRINIISETKFDPEAVIGYVIYERQFRENYKIAKKVTTDDDPLFLAPYPKQEDYPTDDIDEIILSAVKEEFPKSKIKNEIMFSNLDVEQLSYFTKRPFTKANFIVRPDFSGQELALLSGKSFNTFAREINIYTNGSLTPLENLAFWGNCDFATHEKIYSKLAHIKFL